MGDSTLSVADAARMAKILPPYLYALLSAGRLNGHKVNGKWVIDRESFENWRESHRTKRRSAELVRS